MTPTHPLVRLLAVASLILTSSVMYAESVVFDGQTYQLAYDAKNETQILREFLPKGQKLENWTRLTALFDFLQHEDPKPLAVGLLDQVKKQNPKAVGEVMENADTGEYLVTFVSWPPDESYVEFNVFRYSTGKKGVRAQQFAMRAYENFEAFLKMVEKEEQRYLELMATKGLQLKP